jgi:putative flippase GtrA
MNSSLFLSSSIIRFGLVGVVSTAIDITLLNILRRSGAKVWLATGIGFLTGTVTGYLLNSLFVFQQSYTAIRYEKYFLVSIGGLILTEAIMHTLHVRFKVCTLNQAKLVAVCIVFFWNYTLSRTWAFQ